MRLLILDRMNRNDKQQKEQERIVKESRKSRTKYTRKGIRAMTEPYVGACLGGRDLRKKKPE